MTIATRNKFIRIAALVALALAIVSAACVIMTFAKDRLPAEPVGPRPFPALGDLPLAKASAIASMLAIAVYPLFALVGLVYILVAFEKTQTTEITFFAACLFAASIEAFRLFIPLNQMWLREDFLAIAISRAAIASRIFVVLAILASGIFTTGQTAQQIGPSIFLLAFLAFSLGSAIPLNSSRMAGNFLVVPGYSGMLWLFMVLLGALGALSYLIPGKLKDIPEYRQAAGGLALFLLGYAALTLCDSWAFLAAGSALLVAGTAIYLQRLHRYYLWQ